MNLAGIGVGMFFNLDASVTEIDFEVGPLVAPDDPLGGLRRVHRTRHHGLRPSDLIGKQITEILASLPIWRLKGIFPSLSNN